MGHTSSLTSLGVFYEVVSNIPKVSVSNLKMQSDEKNDMFGVQSRFTIIALLMNWHSINKTSKIFLKLPFNDDNVKR